MIVTNIEVFISGAITFACFVVATFFTRFWWRMNDRLFGIFSLAFILFGLERIILLLIDSPDEVRTYVYLVRLAAFALIIWGIVEKNREPH